MVQTLESQMRAVQNRAAKNLRFGIARGLTRTAQQASAAVKTQIPSIFDRPTPFTQNALAITSATKDNLVSSVFVKDLQAKYLEMEETGGIRGPQPGSPINLPVGQRTNAYGNIARGAIGRVKAAGNVFVADGKGRTTHLPPGLYQRLGVRKAKGLSSKRGRKKTTGRGAQPSRLKLLVAFERSATYAPRFGFRDRAAKAANAVLKQNIEASVIEAMQATGPLGAPLS